jgi:hypothetical protein
MGAESGLRNVVIRIKDRTMNNVQNCYSYIIYYFMTKNIRMLAVARVFILQSMTWGLKKG